MSVKLPHKRKQPNGEIIIAWCLFVGSLVGWPISALTIAKEEPPVILGLSWAALAYSALAALFAARGSK